MNGLFLRAVLAFLALPGMVAFVIPLLLITPASRRPWVEPWGLAPLVLGLDRARPDRPRVLRRRARHAGAVVAAAKPRHVRSYRYSRNPMYVGVLLILCGWAIGLWSWPLAIYAAGIAVAFHVRVLLHEEPFLARTHGDAWTAYRARVGRWLSW